MDQLAYRFERRPEEWNQLLHLMSLRSIIPSNSIINNTAKSLTVDDAAAIWCELKLSNNTYNYLRSFVPDELPPRRHVPLVHYVITLGAYLFSSKMKSIFVKHRFVVYEKKIEDQ